MSGNTFGTLFAVTNFGESHGPAIGCVIDGCPPGMALSEADIQGDLDRRRPGTSRRHPAQRARRGRDPLRRVRGQDHRHADLPADPQHRPAQQGLRRHPADLPPRPCRLHLLAEIRPARPARRRALVGAPDRAHGGRRCRGQEVAGPEVRHHVSRLHDADRRDRHPVRELGPRAQQPVLRPGGRCERAGGLHGRCARPATPAARASARDRQPTCPWAWASRCSTSWTPTSPTP
jgi:hypothetical protein